MKKFMEWIGRNSRTIGFVAGAANVGFGISQIVNGGVWAGIFFIVLGLALSLDARMFK
jgi:hypothetical protein